MLEELMEAQGHTAYSLAAAAGVSAESIYRWKDTDVRPHVGNAIAVATVLNAPQLLEEWGYEYAAKQLQGPKTEDAEIANGWRLDTLIDELRETNKLLRRIDNRQANAPVCDRPGCLVNHTGQDGTGTTKENK